MKMYGSNIRESEIEDVLVAYPRILRDILGIDSDLSLVARQMEVKSGRLDLLYLSRNQLYLIELKIEPFHASFLEQLLGYGRDLGELQNDNSLVSGNMNSFLLVTYFDPRDRELCEQRGIELRSYDPEKVLKAFYNSIAGLSNFMTIRPKDYGVWHIHVINRVLYKLPESNTISSLSQALDIAPNTIRNHLKFAEQLGLVRRLEGRCLLTDLGTSFVEHRDSALSVFLLSDAQTQLLREHIVRDPFASNIIFGIYVLVEAVFTLARNSYPVEMKDLLHFYRESVGKRFDWPAERSAFLGANAFSNFAVELGLIARVGDRLLLTPSGFRFILMLQLHKGIKIVDSLGLG